MYFLAKILTLCLLLPIGRSAAQSLSTVNANAPAPSLSQLEQQLTELDSELNQLARFTFRRGAGSIGWSSRGRKKKDHPEWAEIRLSPEDPIDLIVLVPVLWDYAYEGPQASGFPTDFEIIAGTKEHPEGETIAHFRPSDQLLPRIAPLVFPIPPTSASWMRFKSNQMSSSGIYEQYTFGFSEIMLFSGQRNVAFNRPTRVSSTAKSWGGNAISARALTDESTPFLMDSALGKKSRTYLARFASTVCFSLIIDLGESFPIDEIRFHSASDVRQHIPLPKPVEYGVPKHIIIHGAQDPRFTDATLLLEHQHETIYDIGLILQSQVPQTQCRYIRLTVPQPYSVPDSKLDTYYVNISELEIMSNGKNVAKGKPVQFPSKKIRNDFPKSITDGSNNFGKLLSFRDWMQQLALRHYLERKRPLLVAEINRRYSRQKRNLIIMYWAAGLLASATALTILIDRILRIRHIARVKQRFAANLHDELGANLHSIGLISDVAQNAETKEQWQMLSRRIRDLTERTGTGG